jgi:hypothetical protein
VTAGGAELGDVASALTSEAEDGIPVVGDLVVEAEATKTSGGETLFKSIEGCCGVSRWGARHAPRLPGVRLLQSWIFAPPVFSPRNLPFR